MWLSLSAASGRQGLSAPQASGRRAYLRAQASRTMPEVASDSGPW